MIINIDARGYACPEPVIMTKKAMEQEHDEIVVLVDNKTALENIKRFAIKQNHSIITEENDAGHQLTLKV